MQMMSPLGGRHLQMRLRAVLRGRAAMRLRRSWTAHPTSQGPATVQQPGQTSLLCQSLGT